MIRTRRQRATDRGRSGQALVEFALVLPMLILLFMALLELALGFQAFIAVNRLSQNGAHLASIMGSDLTSDCQILYETEADLLVPNNPNNIDSVVIERTYTSGKPTGEEQKYERGLSYAHTCTLPSGTDVTLPYLQTADTYPAGSRCSVLGGCLATAERPARSTVDNVGVKVRYRHDWVTPLSALLDVLPGQKNGWSFTQRNIFRMEPTL